MLPAQMRALTPADDVDVDICLYQGGFGSGKTHTGATMGLYECMRWPGLKFAVVGDTYTLVRDTTRDKWDELINTWTDGEPGKIVKSWTRTPDTLVFHNGSRVYFRQAGQNLRSMEFGGVHIEEASMLSAEQFREVLSRVRQQPDPEWRDGFIRRVILTTNPQESYGWLSKAFERKRHGNASYRRIIAPTGDNLFLMMSQPDYIDMLRSTMDSDLQRVYIDGETGSLGSGFVYYKFDPDRNISDEIYYDPTLPLCISFDFNVAFMCSVIFQQRPGDTAWAIGEVAQKGSSDTSSICKAFVSRFSDHSAGVRVYGDPSGMHRDTRSSVHDYDIIRSEFSGFRDLTINVNQNDSGRHEFRIRNRVGVANKMLEDRRLLVHNSCKYLIRSLEETRWDANKEGTFKKVKAPPGSDDYVVDHPSDAMDYFIAKNYYIKPPEIVR